MRHLAVCLLLFLLHPSGAFAGFTGPVVSVLDSDTIEVLYYTSSERVRLRGIDCPEKGQAYGNNAKHAASALVFGKESRSKRTARTSTGAPLPMYFWRMARTSITN
jgi:micrococcal nuclease